MSHYVDILTEITDQDSLIKALARLGFNEAKVEVHEKAANLYGYQGDKRGQKAHVIIRKCFVGSSANDIGFERTASGKFRVHISEFDSGEGEYSSRDGKYNKEWQKKLYAYYGVEKSKKEITKKGWKYVEDVDEKKRPRLTITV